MLRDSLSPDVAILVSALLEVESGGDPARAFERLCRHLDRVGTLGDQLGVGRAAIPELESCGGLLATRLAARPYGTRVPHRVERLLRVSAPEVPLGGLDAPLLTLPTPAALRARTALLLDRIGETGPLEAALQVEASGLVATEALLSALSGGNAAGRLTLTEDSQESLGHLRERSEGHGAALAVLEVAAISVATGQVEAPRATEQVVVVDCLVDLLPDRLVRSLLQWCAERLRPDGRLLLTALESTSDEVLWSALLGLPTVRRGPARIAALLAKAGLQAVSLEGGQGLLVEARLAPSGRGGA